MSFLKDGKFWGGVAVGFLVYYVYANHLRGKGGFGG